MKTESISICSVCSPSSVILLFHHCLALLRCLSTSTCFSVTLHVYTCELCVECADTWVRTWEEQINASACLQSPTIEVYFERAVWKMIALVSCVVGITFLSCK